MAQTQRERERESTGWWKINAVPVRGMVI